MGNINHFGPNTTKEVLVDRMIGDAFTIVKEVWEQIPAIIELLELHRELNTRIREAIANIEAETTGSLDAINNARLIALLEIQNKHEAAILDISTRHDAAVEEIEELLALSLKEITDAISLAKDWANKPEDEVVEDGLYSAKHWAIKASKTSKTKDVTTKDTPEIKLSGTGQEQSPLEATIVSVDVSKVDGLGTAATKDVTEGNADVTAGRLLKVGDLGSNIRPPSLLDFNELPDRYPYSGSVPVLLVSGRDNSPPTSEAYYVEQHMNTYGTVTQIAIPESSEHGGMWIRHRVGGEWSPWREISSSGNSSPGEPNIGTPASVTTTSTNSVTEDGHTHELGEDVKFFLNLAYGALQRDNNLSDVVHAGTARDNLGLGTAATRDVTLGVTDTTWGRVLTVGDLGSDKHFPVGVGLPGDGGDYNALPDEFGYSGPIDWVCGDQDNAFNAPPVTGTNFHVVQQHIKDNFGSVTQIAIPTVTDMSGIWIRSRVVGEWEPWKELLHSGHIRTTLGNSAFNPISQLAVTEALDDKVDNTDQRLTDAREWIGETVSQEEAEEGTATTRRAWTAQRVRQAFNAAWEESKEELTSNSNVFTAPQAISTGQIRTPLALATTAPERVMIQFAMGLDSVNPVGVFFGATADGNLGTGTEGILEHVVHTSKTLPVRSLTAVQEYTGNGVTLAEDARAALELGTPTNSDNATLPIGRNRNIIISDTRTVTPLSQHFGKGEFASITIRSNSTTARTVRLHDSILNKRDFAEEYTVTDTEALYLEGRYVDSGFMITFLTMYPIPAKE